MIVGLQCTSITLTSSMTECDRKMLTLILQLINDDAWSFYLKRGRSSDRAYQKVIDLSKKALAIVNKEEDND